MNLDLTRQKANWANGYLVQFGRVLTTTAKAFQLKVPQDKTYVLLLDIAPGNWRIAGKGTDLTLKVTKENGSAFVLLNKGMYRVSPNSTGLLMKTLAVQAVPTPVPPQNQVWYKGQLLKDCATIRKDGQLLLPLARFGQVQGNTLTFDGKIPVRMKVGDRTVNVNGYSIPLQHTLDKDFAVPAGLAGGLLGMDMEADVANGTILLTVSKEQSDICCVTATDGESELRDMLLKKRGVWIAHGRRTRADILFAKPVSLSGINFNWPHGLVRKQFFKVELSLDGKTFETVFDGESSGRDLEQKIEFPKRDVRLIRLYMKGNSSNTWNTVGPITLRP